MSIAWPSRGPAVVAVRAFATTKLDVNRFQSRAGVVPVEARYETSSVAPQVCRVKQVTRRTPVKDVKRIAGTAIGAVVSGVPGNQTGGGDVMQRRGEDLLLSGQE